jgi:hypothetical protein
MNVWLSILTDFVALKMLVSAVEGMTIYVITLQVLPSIYKLRYK